MRAKSEGELLHTVKGFLQMIQSNGAGNAEVTNAGSAENTAGSNHDVRLLQEIGAESLVLHAGLGNAGECVERATRTIEREIGNLRDAIGYIVYTVAVLRDVFLRNLVAQG